MTINLTKPQIDALLRCAKDDFDAYYDACVEDPYEDHSSDLDAMEEDLDLIEGLLPQISNTREGDDAVSLILAELKRKLAECC